MICFGSIDTAAKVGAGEGGNAGGGGGDSTMAADIEVHWQRSRLRNDARNGPTWLDLARILDVSWGIRKIYCKKLPVFGGKATDA
jgi:hypothetical protein